MKCARCDTSCAPPRTKTLSPNGASLCLNCLWVELREALDILELEVRDGYCFCIPLGDDPCTWCRAKTFVNHNKHLPPKSYD